MQPAHILWINMVTTVTLGLTLAFEPAEPGVMCRPPRRRDAPLLPGYLLWRVGLVSVLFMLGVFAVYGFAIEAGRGVAVAQTMVVNAIVVMEMFYLFNVRYQHMTSFSLRGAAGTPPVLAAIAAVVVAQAAFTYLPAMQALLGTAPLRPIEGALVIGLGVLLMLVMEVEKGLARRLGIAQG